VKWAEITRNRNSILAFSTETSYTQPLPLVPAFLNVSIPSDSDGPGKGPAAYVATRVASGCAGALPRSRLRFDARAASATTASGESELKLFSSRFGLVFNNVFTSTPHSSRPPLAGLGEKRGWMKSRFIVRHYWSVLSNLGQFQLLREGTSDGRNNFRFRVGGFSINRD
jgi:hypothetical protein